MLIWAINSARMDACIPAHTPDRQHLMQNGEDDVIGSRNVFARWGIVLLRGAAHQAATSAKIERFMSSKNALYIDHSKHLTAQQW